LYPSSVNSPHLGTGGFDPIARKVASLAVAGLSGDGSLMVDEATELDESFVLTLALEKVE